MARATCGCCFREQAVLPNGKIHTHGYKLPREWMKVGACDGEMFRPLEVSDEGPKHMLNLVTKSIAMAVQNLKDLKAAKVLQVIGSNLDCKTGKRVEKTLTVKEGEYLVQHGSFQSIRNSRIWTAERNLEAMRADKAKYEKVIREWKPQEVK
jgi:hypothetical protein